MNPADDPSPLPSIHIQVAPMHLVGEADDRRMTRGPREQMRKLTDAQMEGAFATAEQFAGHAAAMLARLRAHPEQRDLSGVEIEFGLAFSTELTVYVVGVTADASLKVKLAWSPTRQE